MSVSVSVCVCVCVGERVRMGERENRGGPVMSVWCCCRAAKVEKQENEHQAGEVGLQKQFTSARVIEKDSLKK